MGNGVVPPLLSGNAGLGLFLVGCVVGTTSAFFVLLLRSSSPTGLGGFVTSFVRELWYPLYVVATVAYLAIRWWYHHGRSVLLDEDGVEVGGRTWRRLFFRPPHTHTARARTATTAAVVPPESSSTQRQKQGLQKERLRRLSRPIDLTGAYRLISNENFEAFLAAQGVPWALRSAANRARPLHRISHGNDVDDENDKDDNITIKIEGIIESQTTYTIGGPPVEGVVRGRRFLDRVTYLTDDGNGEAAGAEGGAVTAPVVRRDDDDDRDGDDDNHDDDNSIVEREEGGGGQPHPPAAAEATMPPVAPAAVQVVGIQTTKRAVEDGYTVYVQRRLAPCGTKLFMESRVEFDDDTKETVKSSQIFQRVEEG